MDDQMNGFLSFINGLDSGTVLVVAAVVCYVIYHNWVTITDFFDTYFFGKYKQEETKETPLTKYDQMMKNLEEMSENLSRIQDSQDELIRNQESLRKELKDLKKTVDENYETTSSQIEYISNQCDFLKICDKEDKKAFITREYNYFTRLGEIDLFSKETIEKIYELYLKENGDTFVAGMMSQIRTLKISTKGQLNPNALLVPEVSANTIDVETVETNADSHSN